MPKQLANFDADAFLNHYWQRKPLLIKNALPHLGELVSGDDLAGLSLEEDIDSRIVQGNGTSKPWQLNLGPFTEATYQNLEEANWTLLVQGVDRLSDDIAALKHYFSFLPRWRFDDVMVSYATLGGSVGPHTDRYDVFLVQGQGTRTWRVGVQDQASLVASEESGLSLVVGFNEYQEWQVETGDIVYIPPRTAHWGIANSECVTYSIGFRSPSLADMVQAVCDTVVDQLDEDQRYTDEKNPTHSISEATLTRATNLISEQLLTVLDKPEAWFAPLVTTADQNECGDESLCLQDIIENNLSTGLGTHVRWSILEQANQSPMVYINGEQQSSESEQWPKLLSKLDSDSSLEPAWFSQPCEQLLPLLLYWLEQGWLVEVETH